MGFDTRFQSSSVSDDTAMTGLRIKCNNRDLTDEHYLEDYYNYGIWKTQENSNMDERLRNLMSCGSVLKWEAHQGAFHDDTALNGYMTEICHEFISNLTGFWALRPQKAKEGEGLVATIESKVTGRVKNQPFYGQVNFWHLLKDAFLEFDVYGIKTEIKNGVNSDSNESKRREALAAAFKQESRDFNENFHEEIHCKAHDDTHLFQWVW